MPGLLFSITKKEAKTLEAERKQPLFALSFLDKNLSPSTEPLHHFCCHLFMNFWEYKEDHSQAYFHTANKSDAYQNGKSIARFFFFWPALLFKATFSLLKSIVILITNTVQLLARKN